MTDLDPLQPLFDVDAGAQLPLTDELRRLYGPLRLPVGAPRVIGNFVSTLDGVVSFAIPGQASGRDISGNDPHDRMVMGLLRAVADVVVISGSIFNASSTRRWTAENAFPPLREQYRSLRRTRNSAASPLVAIVTATGRLDLVNGVSDQRLLVLTTANGKRQLQRQVLPPSVQVVAVDTERLTARQVLSIIQRIVSPEIVLVETGPRLMGTFLREGCLDELFLTIAPHVAGRGACSMRPGFVAGQAFAPNDSPWASLVSARRAGSYLFLRYSFNNADRTVDQVDCG